LDVSVIIVNYNTISLLVDAIDSVFDKTEGVEYEIIVVDNASSDNSKNILADKYGNKVIYLALPENIGFGRANNEAAKIAKGRNLFFLNPDTILLNNAVKILSDYLDNNPRVGCCGGNLYDADGKPTNSFCRFFVPSVFEEINHLFFLIPEKILYRNNLIFNNTDKSLEVGYITGADLMIRKNLFDILNGFDPDFFMYYEETELEYRVKKMNFIIINVPSARIIHMEGKSNSDNYEKLRKLFLSRMIFLYKVYDPISIVIINILFHFRIISRLLIFTILKNNEKITLWLEIRKIVLSLKKD
jgi:GT2 family glycosyltransferase